MVHQKKNGCEYMSVKLAAYCTDRSKDPLLISECPFWASLYWAYSFRTKMQEKQHQADIFSKWKSNWTNLPGLDVVWFPNPRSPLVSRMSRGVAVSGASAVFRVFKIYDPDLQRLGDWPIYLGSIWSVWSGFPTQVLLWFLDSQGLLLILLLRLFSEFLLKLLLIYISCFDYV